MGKNEKWSAIPKVIIIGAFGAIAVTVGASRKWVAFNQGSHERDERTSRLRSFV